MEAATGGVRPRRASRPVAFTPWGRLIEHVGRQRGNALGLSSFARLLLQHLLEHVGKQDANGEAMYWRALGGIATDTGKSTGSVKRALRELRDAGLVRARRVETFQELPSGRRATAPVGVYYVHVARLRERLGLVGEAAVRSMQDRINHDPIDGIMPTEPVREIAAESGAPLSAVVNSVVKTLKEPQNHRTGNPAHPTPMVLGDCLDIASQAFGRWWDAIGRHRPDVTNQDLSDVRRALNRAVAEAGATLAQLCDVIDGAASEEVGGRSYGYCKEHNIWGKGLFWNFDRGKPSGCLERIPKEVAAERSRRARETAAANRPAPPRRRPDEAPAATGGLPNPQPPRESASAPNVVAALPPPEAPAASESADAMTFEQVQRLCELLRQGRSAAEAQAEVLGRVLLPPHRRCAAR